MAKIPDNKSEYNKLERRLMKYVRQVLAVYDSSNLEAAKIALMSSYDALGGMPFSFDDYPELKDKVRRMLENWVKDLQAIIYAGTSQEWKKSNEIQDLLANGVLDTYKAKHGGKEYTKYFQVNSDALRTFQERKDRGMDISQKLWNQSADYKQGLETAISTAIQRGTSAITLSKQISQYLNDFKTLQKDYTDKFGHASDARDCEYKSIRLARSEINMAYRNAEQLRWRQMDFVVGYEIHLSYSHPVYDICDVLKGKYPKDFKWSGWHPNELCYVTSILKTEEEFWSDDRNIVSKNEVKDVPDAFKKWVVDNKERIERAEKRKTLPYFIKDNKELVKGITPESTIKEVMNKAKVVGPYVQSIAEMVAKKCRGFCTPINYKSAASIKRKMTSDECTAYDLKDTVRTTIIVNRKNIEKALTLLSEEKGFYRLKRQLPDKFLGYSGNIVNIKTNNGLIGEIQVNTAEMIYAKEIPDNAKNILGEKLWISIHDKTGMEGGLGHKYYEKIRMLNKQTEFDEYMKLKKKSEEYYSHFNGK